MKTTYLLTALSAGLVFSLSAHAGDPAAAKKLFKLNDCGNCHAPDKTKKGPSLKSIAEKYKGKEAEGEQKMIKNMTTASRVKLADGTEDDHKIIDTKDPAQLKNIAEWILSTK